jgi:hypothetical protein
MKKVLLLLTLALAAPATARGADVTMVSRDVPLGPRALAGAAQAPIRFDMLGLHWQGPGAVSFRTLSPAGRWTRWSDADADSGPDAGSAEAERTAAWHDGNLAWTGVSTRAQFRIRGQVTRLRAYYVSSRVTKRPARTLSLAGSPSIVPRTSWEADEKIVRAKPLIAPELKLAVVHHTANTNSYTPSQAAAIVRGIEVYHVRGNGWNDIGYNFLVDRYGTVYEGRGGGIDENVVGAHALGFNYGTVGVALIGNFTAEAPPPAMQAALTHLLAWRLDVAHVDPLSTVAYTSGGNAKFRAGKVVVLHSVSGHRDTGPTDCPGNVAYALLPGVAKSVARIGLPKLYSPVVSGLVGGPVRFQARLSSSLRWTVNVTTGTGKVVAHETGRSSLVDWTWSSAGAGRGPFRWSIEAGPNVVPAAGTLGAAPPPPKPAPAPVQPVPAPVPAPAPVPVQPAPAPAPAPALLTGVTAAPAVVTPVPGSSALPVTVGFALSAAAVVTVRAVPAAGTAPAVSLFGGPVPAGTSSYQYDVAGLPDGRYSLVVTATPAVGTAATQSLPLTVDRTLTGLTVSPTPFSPNADGLSDTIGFGFLLTRSVPVQVVVQRAGSVTGTVFSGQLGPGQQSLSWDGTSNGLRLADGDYVVVVTETDPFGTVSLLAAFTIDTAAPALSVVDGSALSFQLSEAATVTVVVNGQTITLPEPAGVFTVPFAGGPVTSFSVQARDAAGNASAMLNGP